MQASKKSVSSSSTSPSPSSPRFAGAKQQTGCGQSAAVGLVAAQALTLKEKSIAQRVMDVATSEGKQSAGNSSAENDNEVEAITNKAAKLNISPVNSSTSSKTCNSQGSHTNCEISDCPQADKSSPGLASNPTVCSLSDSSSSCQMLLNTLATANSSSASQVSAKDLQLGARTDTSNTKLVGDSKKSSLKQRTSCLSVLEPSRISLETKVPHPSATNHAAFQQDEVSYYNDAQRFNGMVETTNSNEQHQRQHPLEPKQVGGSLDNSVRPRLLLAAHSICEQQRLCATASGSCQLHLQQMQHQQKSPRQPKSSSSCQQLRNSNAFGSQLANDSQFDRNNNKSPSNGPLPNGGGPSYEHNYMSADYDDVYELRYDNALVVEEAAAEQMKRAHEQQQQKQQQQQQLDCTQNHHQRDTSSNYSMRYQEIASPPPPSPTAQSLAAAAATENCSSQTSLAAVSLASRSSHSSSKRQTVSASVSPKAKSAPATPCNITPIAFHQAKGGGGSRNCAAGSQLGAMLDHPSLAHTLPPDIRKNISATCRVLPSSVGKNGAGASARFLSKLQQQDQKQQHQTSNPSTINLKYLDSFIESGEFALNGKDYNSAIKYFSQCINLATDNQNVVYLKKNFKIYSQRAEAHFNLGNYNEAIDDSMAARELNPKWTKAYYLQGRSQFMIGQYADSLAVFAFGLTQDPTNELLFGALIETALSSCSNFKQDFEPKFNKLKSLHLNRRPFIIISILGQELLAKGHSEHAAIVLESALKLSNCSSPIGSSSSSSSSPPSATSTSATGLTSATSTLSTSLGGINQKKFKGSVLSTIALAYCALRDYEKAIYYMVKELEFESELEDVEGQCRVLSNLGYAYFKVRKFDKSLEAHRKQLNLAIKNRLFPQASQALNAIGHVHVAKYDYSNALTSHTRCLDILKQLGDDAYGQFKETLSVGHVHLMLNELDEAEEKFNEANQLLEHHQVNQVINHEQFTNGVIMINFNLAHLALKRQLFKKAKQHYIVAMEKTKSLSGSNAATAGSGSTAMVPNSNCDLITKQAIHEIRACNGLGQTCRFLKRFDEAREWFEKQLQIAKSIKDQVSQSQALCNLGMICQHFEDYQGAWRLFDENLKFVDSNPILKAYAHSYLGSTYYLMGHLKESREHYEISLSLFKDLGYCSAEQRTIDELIENLVSIQRRANYPEVVNSATTATVMTMNNNLPNTTSTNQKKVMLAS